MVDGMVIGLGSGTTVAEAIGLLGARVAAGLCITAIATSRMTASLAKRAKIPLLDFSDKAFVDLAIDGVDEIDPACRAIKGAGGAMLREKVVGTAAGRMIAIADASKQVARLGTRPLPVEVLPFAAAFASGVLADLGVVTTLRRSGSKPYLTDQGNWIIDCTTGDLADPDALAASIAAIPGVLAHGLFLTEIDALYIAGPGPGVVCREREAVALPTFSSVRRGNDKR
jgi:ribose 5-phosphate isomerase A